MKATASSAIEIISKLSHNKHSLETFTDEEGYYNIIIGGKVSGNVTDGRDSVVLLFLLCNITDTSGKKWMSCC